MHSVLESMPPGPTSNANVASVFAGAEAIVSSPDDERDARPLHRFSQVFLVPLTTRWAVLRRVPMSVVCWVAGL